MTSLFNKLLPFSSRSAPMAAERAEQWLSHSDPDLLKHLSSHDRIRLAERAQDFRKGRHISGALGFSVNEAMCQRIAVEACLPVLNLGLDEYASVKSIIVYPSGFVPNDSWVDDDGVVHAWDSPLAGSAAELGPVILAWDEVSEPAPHSQVVIHEFAHVLDAGNGQVNGFPDIREPTLRHAWPTVFTHAYNDLCYRLDSDLPVEIDPYAAENPAECFAVMCETFFTSPQRLKTAYPALYDMLAAYFLQETAP